jgi:hypothetical protein
VPADGAPADGAPGSALTLERRRFFDVRRSVRGLAWEHRLDPRQENIALAIAQSTCCPTRRR